VLPGLVVIIEGDMLGALTEAYDGLLAGGMAFADLTLRQVTENEIVHAIESGTVLNSGGTAGSFEDIPSDEDVSGRYLDIESEPPRATAILDGGTLRKVLLRYAGKSRGEEEYDPRGLRLEQVVITGDMNWSWLDLPFPIGFWGCAFDEFVMNVDHATVPRLVFEGCLFGPPRWGKSSFNATESKFDGAIRFLDCEGLSQLFLLDCELATFELRDHPGGAEQAFRLVLAGSTIGEFKISGDNDPAETIPAKDGLNRIQIQRLTLNTWDDERDRSDIWRARWIQKWLAGGAVPHALRKKTAERAELNPHRRQVWSEFAGALDREFLEDDAVQLRIAAERHRDSTQRWLTRAVRWLTLDLTVRYFHRNVRAVGWLALIWLVVATLAWFNIHDLYRDDSGSGPAGPLQAGADGLLWASAYGLDVVISPLQLGFDAVWPTAPLLIVIFAVLKLLAITMFGLFVVGISGVVQRSRS
jgi:hypothetical protein